MKKSDADILRNSVLTIREEKVNNLRISLEYDDEPSQLYPMLLYTPHMDDTDEHFHIPLSRDQAERLSDWLKNFLERR